MSKYWDSDEVKEFFESFGDRAFVFNTPWGQLRGLLPGDCKEEQEEARELLGRDFVMYNKDHPFGMNPNRVCPLSGLTAREMWTLSRLLRKSVGHMEKVRDEMKKALGVIDKTNSTNNIIRMPEND